jgi:peptidoglycan/xylan/chitin deacetylase (PgdA/CDA1 family)
VISIPILLYHSVSADPLPWIRPLTVSPKAFRRHLELIREAGATALSVTECADALASAGSLPERPVVITFDDGLADFRDQAMPSLRGAGCAVTLFVTTGFLEDLPQARGVTRPAGPWLDSAALLDLREQGVEIGAHTHTHPHLDTLSVGAARAEIASSKEILEELLGAPVPSFSYPHGYHSRTVRRLVRVCGFESACAVKNTLSSSADDVFSLARLTVRADTSLAHLGAWLEGRGAPVAPRRERMRTRGWRVYRRSRAVVRRRPGSDWA